MRLEKFQSNKICCQEIPKIAQPGHTVTNTYGSSPQPGHTVTNTHGSSPQPTACRSPTSSLTTATGSNQAKGKV